jgi:hypothetical protein
LTNSQFADLCSLYENHYGKGAVRYLTKTYDSWRTGTTRMAGQTCRRILECVPPVLPLDDQFTILSSYGPERLTCLVRSIRHSADLHDRYRALCLAIIDDAPEFPWFAKGIFPASELSEFTSVFRFSLLEQVRQSYCAVVSDIKLLRDLFADSDHAHEVTYRIELIGESLDGQQFVDLRERTLPELPRPALATRFEPYLKRLLVERGVDRMVDSVRGKYSQEIMVIDISHVREHIRALDGASVSAQIKAKGAGGLASIRLERKDVPTLWAGLVGKSLAAICVSIGSIWLIAVLVSNEAGGFVLFVVLFGIAVVASLLANINETAQEIREYERRRQSPFAAARSNETPVARRLQ